MEKADHDQEIQEKEKGDIEAILGTVEKEMAKEKTETKAEKAKEKIKEKMVRAKEEEKETEKAKTERDPTVKKEKVMTKEEKVRNKRESQKEKEKMVIIEADRSKEVNRQKAGHPRVNQIDRFVSTFRKEDVRQERIVTSGTLAHARHFRTAIVLTEEIVFSFITMEKVITDADDHRHQEDSTTTQEDTQELLMKEMKDTKDTKETKDGMKTTGKLTIINKKDMMINGKTLTGMKVDTLKQLEMQVMMSNGSSKKAIVFNNSNR